MKKVTRGIDEECGGTATSPPLADCVRADCSARVGTAREYTIFMLNHLAGADIRKRAFRFACDIVQVSRGLPKSGPEVRILSTEMLRSAASIGANLEEAAAGHTRKDFLCKCQIALKEARETRYWMRLLGTCLDPAGSTRLSAIISEANELVAILTAIVKNTRQNLAAKQKR